MQRFTDPATADALKIIDIDGVLWAEFRPNQSIGLLVETAEDVGQSDKKAYVTQNLARRANLPALVVLYQKAGTLNPVDNVYQDIDRFRVRRLCPKEDADFSILTPTEYVQLLRDIRLEQTLNRLRS